MSSATASASTPDARRPKSGAKGQHRFRFFRAGGVDQVMLRDASDLRALRQLDGKLWVALAMPTRGVHLDAKTLQALDRDGDGRIRMPDILAALDWLDETLRDLGVLFSGGEALPLTALEDGPVLEAARLILQHLGKREAEEVTLDDVAETTRTLSETRFNGDGIVPADAAGDDTATRKAIEDVIAVQGSVPDRSGKPGIDRPRLEAFFAEVRAIAAWQAEADPALRALAPAAEALSAVCAKVDDWFTRARLAAFEPRTAPLATGTEAELLALAAKDLSIAPEELRRLPLARVAPGGPLALDGGINPAWQAAVEALRRDVLSGARTLDEAAWQAAQARVQPHRAWLARKPATAVEKLGLARVAELAASDAEAKIGALLVQDLQLETELAQLGAVEKALLFQRDLLTVLNNFVNFSAFYAKKGAAFQAGTLYLDGRSCHLCLDVADAAKHATLAPMSGAFLAYCDCTRQSGEKLTIAAAFTDGDADNLMVGRNGLFFDRQGRDWDATITRIVANPISIREAFWSPYKKLVRLIEEQVGKRASAADAEQHAKLKDTATLVTEADKQDPKKEPPKPKIDVGTVAALGVAIGGIGAMVTGILSAFFGLGFWMPLGVVAVFLAISGPSMLLAWLKLRQRNLGPLLDANGWAINGRARINVPFGGALTDVAALPRGAERSLKDPYAEKKQPWGLYLFLLVLAVAAVLWSTGRLDPLLPERARAATLLHRG